MRRTTEGPGSPAPPTAVARRCASGSTSASAYPCGLVPPLRITILAANRTDTCAAGSEDAEPCPPVPCALLLRGGIGPDAEFVGEISDPRAGQHDGDVVRDVELYHGSRR